MKLFKGLITFYGANELPSITPQELLLRGTLYLALGRALRPTDSPRGFLLSRAASDRLQRRSKYALALAGPSPTPRKGALDTLRISRGVNSSVNSHVYLFKGLITLTLTLRCLPSTTPLDAPGQHTV